MPSREKRDGLRRWTSAAVVLVRPIDSRAGVVAEGTGGPVGGQLPSGADPDSAPPEAGDPGVLEPLGEVPQVGEGEGASERTASNSHVDEMIAAGRATAGGP